VLGVRALEVAAGGWGAGAQLGNGVLSVTDVV
jgi:hypothetical protein